MKRGLKGIIKPSGPPNQVLRLDEKRIERARTHALMLLSEGRLDEKRIESTFTAEGHYMWYVSLDEKRIES